MIEQRTTEWDLVRLGKVTASRINDVVATIKSGESASRRNYRTELVVERLTGRKTESFTSPAMQWGIDNEPLARGAWETKHDKWVDQVGFVDHPTIPMTGCSPDGLVDDDGLIEIKCLTTANHINALLTNTPPSEYINQCYWQMACTGRKWNRLVLFDPRLPENLQLCEFLFTWDDKVIADLESKVIEFLNEVDATVNKLKGL